jgi:5-methylcytosine-specific restriction enzyme B
MNPSRQRHLPLLPLLNTYITASPPSAADLGKLPGLGRRFAAVLSATARFLYPAFLDEASDADLCDALMRFYEAVVDPPLHADALRRHIGVVRHGVNCLLHGRDPLAARLEACVAPSGAYHVSGLGPVFWSALFQAAQRARRPGWTPAILAGLRRLGLARWQAGAGPGAVYVALATEYQAIQRLAPAMLALHIDHFLTLIASMSARDLWQGAGDFCPIAAAVQRVRGRFPLRQRLKEQGAVLERARERLEAGLAQNDGAEIGAALAEADAAGAGRCGLDWPAHGEMLTLWVGRVWETDDPYPLLARFWEADPLPGAGLWLPAAVLHLRDPQTFAPWCDVIHQGYAPLDDALDGAASTAERYRLFNEGAARLRADHRIHPLETADVLAALAPEAERRDAKAPMFGGFCADTFRFLRELAGDNRREWMEGQRDRYHFAVREPMMELCRTLAARYVEPVLHGVHGWDIDAEARSGHALTSICKNAYGRSQPYNTTLWIAFCPRRPGGRRDVQLFVRLDAAGLRYGLRIGRKAKDACRRFRAHSDKYGDLFYRTLCDGGALACCRFGRADVADPVCTVAGPDDLRQWATGRSFEIACELPPDAPLLTSDALAGEILLTFDRLLPAYACAVEDDPLPFLASRAGADSGHRYSETDFRRATFLPDDWLRRARGLLDLKRQIILQGVPGTGKTHVARSLARLLTGGRDDAVRLVQFHPAYSYEEFVEGVKVRSVETGGHHDLTYPVEDGLLCAFAAEAALRPSEPHVLIIDEINRGNLPRIFGELLYLLEYREQAVGLPYSRRPFRLPANLYLIGTMNAADRSTALVDQALRRRFSFVEMTPDASVLAAWLRVHPPTAGSAFADKVTALFERLNARLRADLGAQIQVGHSYFMAPDLDEQRLRLMWQHHIRPLLDEYFSGQPGRAAAYDLDQMLDGEVRRPNDHRRRPARV